MGLDASHVASHDDFCTAFTVGRHGTADGSILAGQNLDQHPANRDLVVILHVEPDYWSCDPYVYVRRAYRLPRSQLRACEPFSKCAVEQELAQRRHASLLPQEGLARANLDCRLSRGHTAIQGVLLGELPAHGSLRCPAGPGTSPIFVGDGCGPRQRLVHTNHFQDPGLVSDDMLLPDIPDSVFRAERMSTLIRRRRGHLTVAELRSPFARSRQRPPTSICRQQPNFVTIAALIAEPDQGRPPLLHVGRWVQECLAYCISSRSRGRALLVDPLGPTAT